MKWTLGQGNKRNFNVNGIVSLKNHDRGVHLQDSKG